MTATISTSIVFETPNDHQIYHYHIPRRYQESLQVYSESLYSISHTGSQTALIKKDEMLSSSAGSDPERRVSYGIGGAGNIRKFFDGSTGADQVLTDYQDVLLKQQWIRRATMKVARPSGGVPYGHSPRTRVHQVRRY